MFALQSSFFSTVSAASDDVALSKPGANLGKNPGAPLRVILARFASMPGLSAEFREEKRIALLREPLVSQGSIYFAPPERLARYVRTPIPSIVLLIGDRVSYDFKGDRGELDIDSHPMIRGMSSIIRLLLAGNAVGLEKLFSVKAEVVDSDLWEIFLVPIHAPMRDSIATIRVRGAGGKLRELHIAERNGDETTTRFSVVDTTRRFSASEVQQFFRLPES